MPGYEGGNYWSAGMAVAAADHLSMMDSRIEGFTDFPGLALVAPLGAFYPSGNALTRNRVGLFIQSGVGSPADRSIT